MDTWFWLTIIAVLAVAVSALVWWSSSRARPRGRGPENSLTQSQVERISQFQSGNTQNRAGFGS
jgi:hypothetical protein